MSWNFIDMQTVYSLFKATVNAISENENTLKRNKQVLTGEIGNLRSKYSNKFGDEETSQVNEIEKRNNGTPVKTDLEIKMAQESANEEWQTGVFGIEWSIEDSLDSDRLQIKNAKDLNDKAYYKRKDGILKDISQQEED